MWNIQLTERSKECILENAKLIAWRLLGHRGWGALDDFSQGWLSLYIQHPKLYPHPPHWEERKYTNRYSVFFANNHITAQRPAGFRILKPEQERVFVGLELLFPWLRNYHMKMWHRECTSRTQVWCSDICFSSLIWFAFLLFLSPC